MFGLAAILAATSIGWPYFERQTPRISELLQAVVASRVVWFFSGVIPAVVFGIRLSEFLRRRRASKAKSITWHPPLEAMEAFARPFLLERLRRIQKQIIELEDESRQVDARVSELQEASICEDKKLRQHYVDELLIEIAKQKDLSNRSGRSIDELENCYEAMRADIRAKLSNGHLMAKGFRSPHTPTTPEVMIPMGEWRFLILDYDDDKALAPNFEYIALMIGRHEN
ncbi:hypothetical protein [Bradyrhizobium sp.]|uniref:hypothetical protein n=1 Tax=Bradyrhizobium sp. TaxID=376 RepID=UPI003C5E7F02